MKAVDTNILARFILNDHPAQAAAAERCLAAGAFIPLTVLLETGWLLGSRYGFDRPKLADTLERLLDVPTVHVGDEAAVREAVALFRSRADLADAIHLVAAAGSEAFVTFDAALARLSGTATPIELATTD